MKLADEPVVFQKTHNWPPAEEASTFRLNLCSKVVLKLTRATEV